MAWKRVALALFPGTILAMLWADIILLRLVAHDPGSRFLWMSSDFFREPIFSFIYTIQYFSGSGEKYVLCVAAISLLLLALSFSRYYRTSGFLFSHLLTLGFFFACADKAVLSAALYPENMRISFEAGFFDTLHIGHSQALLIAFGIASCAMAHIFVLTGGNSRRQITLRLLELRRF